MTTTPPPLVPDEKMSDKDAATWAYGLMRPWRLLTTLIGQQATWAEGLQAAVNEIETLRYALKVLDQYNPIHNDTQAYLNEVVKWALHLSNDEPNAAEYMNWKGAMMPDPSRPEHLGPAPWQKENADQ